MKTKNTVPVGATPVPKYTSWEEHRAALRREAAARRVEVEAKRNVAHPAA